MAVKADMDNSSVASATYTIVSLEHAGTEADPYTVADARTAIDANTNVTGVYATGIVSEIVTAYNSQYGNISYNISADGSTTADQLEVYRGKSYNGESFTSENDIKVGDVVVVYGDLTKHNSTYEFAQNNQLVSLVRPGGTKQTVTLSFEFSEATHDISESFTGLTLTTDPTGLSVTYSSSDENVATVNATTGIVTMVGAGSTTITATFVETDDYYGTEASYTLTVTNNNAAATLPFTYDGNGTSLPDGLSQSGLGTYSSSPAMKFDSTGDELILKFNERPGKLTFDIKGNTFSGGTFTVQTSEDGMTYTDLETYTELGSTQSEEFSNLGENVRYIKWIYTNKSSGNVALGNINLAAYVAPANYDLSVTLSDNINAIYVFDTEDDTNPLIEEGAAGTIQVTNGTRIMVSPDVAEGYQLASLTVDGNDVTSQIDETGAYTFTMPTHNVTITATAEETVVPVTASYVLATSITSGKHYVIANGKEDGTVKVMGVQNNNNRGAVDATIAEGVLSVSDEYEFIIESASVTEGETEVSGYAIYDESGYLYAASSSSNHLKTQETNNANGIWTITFDEESNVASVVAQGSNSRNNMRYNSSSTIFSCYSSGQQDIYLFEKVEAPAQSQSVTVTSACYATFVAEADLDIPEGVEVFAVTVNGAATSAHLEAIEDGIPEGEAVLVKASADTYEFPYATEAVAALTIDNDLKAATTAFNPSAANTIYCLAQKSGTVGFYPVATTVTIPAGKAYLETTSGEAPVKGFYGFDDDATGIEAIDHSPLTIEGAVYNLAGQRLQKMQKGINIVNGKKIAVK